MKLTCSPNITQLTHKTQDQNSCHLFPVMTRLDTMQYCFLITRLTLCGYKNKIDMTPDIMEIRISKEDGGK